MNILITGAAGQAGSYLTELFLDLGFRVIGLVRRNSTSESHWRIHDSLKHKNFVLEVGDVTDNGIIFSLLSKYKPELIYNTAAQSHVHISFSQPGYTWDVVAKGVLNILENIRLIRDTLSSSYNPHFVQFSSSEMFGSNATNVNGEDVQNEKTPFLPNSPYSVAKLAAHNYCLLYRRAYQFNVSPVILFNYESPRRGEQFVTKKITKWIANLKYNKEKNNITSVGDSIIGLNNIDNNTFDYIPKLKLGNIESVRDWGHCKDYMKAMVKIGLKGPGDYILSTGEIYSVKNFLYKCFQYIGINEKFEQYYNIDPNLFRPLEVPYLKGECTRTMKLLNWKPLITVDDLVKEMIDFDYETIRRRAL